MGHPGGPGGCSTCPWPAPPDRSGQGDRHGEEAAGGPEMWFCVLRGGRLNERLQEKKKKKLKPLPMAST